MYNPSEKRELVDRIKQGVIKQLAIENNLELWDKIIVIDLEGNFALSFQYRKEIDVNEARELIVDTGAKFLREINKNKKIRYFFSHYPLRIVDIELEICMNGPKNEDFGLEKLSYLTLRHGLITYFDRDPQFRRLKIINIESFEEAVELLRDCPQIKASSILGIILADF
ncbi:MAG TPA: hypothetical protein VGJ00_00925 [Rhabdochlamydiaceae bacterium]